MNKIITTITYTILSVIFMCCNNVQKIDETVSETAISSDETNKTFILTESIHLHTTPMMSTIHCSRKVWRSVMQLEAII